MRPRTLGIALAIWFALIVVVEFADAHGEHYRLANRQALEQSCETELQRPRASHPFTRRGKPLAVSERQVGSDGSILFRFGRARSARAALIVAEGWQSFTVQNIGPVAVRWHRACKQGGIR